MDDVLARYRIQFVQSVLHKAVGRIQFDSVIDFGCGDGANLRVLISQMGAKSATGVDLQVAEVCSGPLILHRESPRIHTREIV
jgi:2-polyprenyl-3-methyl-5-hydroxy-6-metoxy-1,4-benzoquinol methylase